MPAAAPAAESRRLAGVTGPYPPARADRKGQTMRLSCGAKRMSQRQRMRIAGLPDAPCITAGTP